jgi:hypothetical protein
MTEAETFRTAPAATAAQRRARVAAPASATLPSDARELIQQRFEAGRRERGRAEGEPFRWDREPIGADEIEELADAYVYRRERYRLWYGPTVDRWPFPARQRLDDALHALEDLLAELRHGPIEAGDTVERRE